MKTITKKQKTTRKQTNETPKKKTKKEEAQNYQLGGPVPQQHLGYNRKTTKRGCKIRDAAAEDSIDVASEKKNTDTSISE